MNIKKYIIENVEKILGVTVIVEVPPKDEMGDYSIQCANYRTAELKSPMDVANYIKEHFEDS